MSDQQSTEGKKRITIPELIEILQKQASKISRLESELTVAKLPSFYDLANSSSSQRDELMQFYSFVLQNSTRSSSQLYQDLFAQFICGGALAGDKRQLTFVEFGATNGVTRSNSLSLEKTYNWTGVLAEPDTAWHEALFANRTGAIICTDCVWHSTGEYLDFLSSEEGELSSLAAYAEHDLESMPGNTRLRNASGTIRKVRTISLNDLVASHCNGKVPDYISIDTEGSEFDILSTFDFQEYGPTCFTIEHNFTTSQLKLDEMLFAHGYDRVFAEFTSFDAWYVKKDVWSEIVNQSTS